MISTKIHLKNSQMTYWYHFKHSLSNSGHLLFLSFSSFIHAIFPSILPEHAARGVIKIYNRMKRFAHLKKLQNELKDS
jgi:hypothetical protein